MNKKITILVIILAIAGITYYIFSQISQVQNQPAARETIPVTYTSNPDLETCDYPGFGFSLQYPRNWQVSVVSGAQGGGEMGPVVTLCGKIDAGRLLGVIYFQPKSATSTTKGGMTLLINDIKDKTTDLSKAKDDIIKIGNASYNGHQYVVSFDSHTSTTTQDEILQSFNFVTQ